MTAWWKRLFGIGDKEIEVAKSGDINYLTVKSQGEVLMTIVQPPLSYDGKTGVGGKISVFEASGNFQVGKSKDVIYGEPIILFNHNNKAGLQLQNAVSDAKELLGKVPNSQELKIDLQKLDVDHTIPVPKDSRIGIGSSAMLQIRQDASVSLIRTPKLDDTDRETLKLWLKFLVKALVGKNETYRSNIMTLDPRDNLLKIAAHYNMEGYKDQNISLESNIGCAGQALTNDSETFYDPSTMSGLGVNPDKVWKDLKSIISMPIHDSDGNKLGVLNIDSNKKMEKTDFTDENFKYAMGLAADAFGHLLEKKV